MNPARPLVSAIIATYNYGQYLSRALDSLLAQEGLGEEFELEIIVVDDASTDATAEVVQRYPQVRYIRFSQQQGVSAARNAGIRASTGGYISFLDADDTWLPPKLRVQLPLLRTNPAIGVVYSQGIRRGAGEDRVFPELWEAPSGRVFEAMLTNSFAVHGACLLIRREAFDIAGYFDESLVTAEDLDLSFRLAFHFQFLFEPVPVMVYNISLNGLWLTNAATGSAESDHTRVLRKAVGMLPDSPRYRKIREEAPLRTAMSAMFPFVLVGELTLAWTKLLELLRAHPSSGRHFFIRRRIRWVTRKLLLQSASPLSEARDRCGQIKNATLGVGLRDRRYRQWILAEIWADIVLSGPLRRRVGRRGVAYAAVRAVTYAPSHLALVRAIGARLLKRRNSHRTSRAAHRLDPESPDIG